MNARKITLVFCRFESGLCPRTEEHLPTPCHPALFSGTPAALPHPLTQWGKCRRDYRDFGKCGFESRQRPTGRGSLTVRLRKCLVSPCYPALFPGTPAALPHPLTQWGKCRQAYSYPSQRLARRTGTARGGLSLLLLPHPFPRQRFRPEALPFWGRELGDCGRMPVGLQSRRR